MGKRVTCKNEQSKIYYYKNSTFFVSHISLNILGAPNTQTVPIENTSKNAFSKLKNIIDLFREKRIV